MELCEHLIKHYCKEYKAGNIPCLIGGNYSQTGWRMAVFFKDPMVKKHKYDENASYEEFISPHYEWVKIITCTKCKMSLRFPYNEKHRITIRPEYLPNPDVIVTKDTVIVNNQNEEFEEIPTII